MNRVINLSMTFVLVAVFFSYFIVLQWNEPYSTVIEFEGLDQINADNIPSFTPSENAETIVRLGFAGDIMQHSRYNNADFDQVYQAIKPLTEQFDLMIGNLEFPVLPSQPLGPERFSVQFNGSESHLDALKNNGFDLLSISNNHAYDQKFEGLYETVEQIRNRGMDVIGLTAQTPENPHPNLHIQEVKGIRIALVGYTYLINIYYSEFLEERDWYPPSFPVEVVNFNDWKREGQTYYLPEMRKDLETAKSELNADFVIAYIHWGREWNLTPDEDLQQAAHDLTAAGFDMIIASHQHVMNPIHIVNGKLVAYGLGNLLSDFTPWQSRTSCILEIQLAKDQSGQTTLDNYKVHPTLTDRTQQKLAVLNNESENKEHQNAWNLAERLFGEKVLVVEN